MRISFTEHPASVGETYLQHLRTAAGFSFRLLGGGTAYFVNAIFPSLFKGVGDTAVLVLHDRMCVNRKEQLSIRRARKASKNVKK